MKIGFIGVGTISTAVINGFCMNGDTTHDIYLSPRNAQKSTALAEQYSNVQVCASNQAVIDAADWIILAVLPRLANEILSPLHFPKDKKIISFMTDFSVEKIKEVVGDVSSIVRAVPLSFAAKRLGPIVICPKFSEACELLSVLGDPVAIDDEKKMETMLGITGVMSAYYGLLHEVVEWGEEQGLSKEESVSYTTAFFGALSTIAGKATDGDIAALSNEYTPGGLNEMALKTIRDEQAGYTPWLEALNRIINRLHQK